MSRSDSSLNECVTKHQRGLIPSSSSASILSTSPDEEAYVMLLTNRIEPGGNAVDMRSFNSLCDVTFLVGDNRTPVHAVREVISMRCRVLDQMIDDFEKNQMAAMQSLRFKVKQSVNSKIKKLSCGVVRKKSPQRKSIPIKTIDAEAFKRFMKYIHSGTMTVNASTVLGLLHAANIFDVPELIQPCWDFAMGCAVRADNLHDLLESARNYIDDDTAHAVMTEMIKHINKFPEMRKFRDSLKQYANH